MHPRGMQETACNTRDLSLIPGLENPLEKEMTTHSSILAWEIPWSEETDGVQGVARIGPKLATKPPPELPK